MPFKKGYTPWNEDKETLVRLAFTYKPFWDIDNGKTLCEECHNKTKVYINGAATQ